MGMMNTFSELEYFLGLMRTCRGNYRKGISKLLKSPALGVSIKTILRCICLVQSPRRLVKKGRILRREEF